MTVAAILCLLLVTAIAMAAAYRDVVSFTLPNFLTLSVAVLFLPFAGIMYFSGVLNLSDIAYAVLAGLLVFAVGLAIFMAGALGGGDVKYLAAAALWAWPIGLADFLLVTSISGAGVAAVYLIVPRTVPPHADDEPHAKSGLGRLARPMPYGVAISMGLAYVVARWALQLPG